MTTLLTAAMMNRSSISSMLHGDPKCFCYFLTVSEYSVTWFEFNQKNKWKTNEKIKQFTTFVKYVLTLGNEYLKCKIHKNNMKQ